MYSNAVKLNGLNDYLNPSEECILPVKGNQDKYEIKLKNNLEKNELKLAEVNNDSKKVTVGLSDCLSCSGCLTTSEEIIARKDGYIQIMENINKSETCAVSISPQTVSMFASYYKLDPLRTVRKLSHFFRNLGAKYVYDMSIGEGIALHECKMEFCRRFLEACPEFMRKKFNDGEYIPHNYYDLGFNREALPIISGHCPGWTLYAEKTLTNKIVDKISHISSSQQIQGLLIKTLVHVELYYTQLANLTHLHLCNAAHPIKCVDVPDEDFNIFSFIKKKYPEVVVPCKDIYHVSVAPCYDKKIESLRPQYNYNFKHFFNSLNNTSDDYNVKLVDDCLSTTDIQQILNKLNIDFSLLPEDSLDHLYSLHTHLIYSKYFDYQTASTKLPQICSYIDADYDGYDNLDIMPYIRSSQLYSQSGGFAEEIFKYASRHLFGINISDVKFKKTLNDDFMECLLKVDGKTLLRFVIANGYKNIQNIINQIKKGYYMSFVELMSCPGGCFNGAGQYIRKNIYDYNVLNILHDYLKDTSLYKYFGEVSNNTIVNNKEDEVHIVKASEMAKKSLDLYNRTSRYINTEDRLEVLRLAEFAVPRLNILIDGNVITTILESLENINKNTLKQLRW